ncbi:MAG TPA: tRNA (adenine(22)-N(1))-methyltransferase TrmK [Candidatus Bathyarchaeia archaeon]|jgi:tRNA (adenine22-N1)-methyltransferase|nr:tRNA (adenine(22)-N(1))-methyltransferase TrmK [Candidatus Bathyarchaeia archaeon]
MLSPRLAAVASLVPEGSVAADVGAGHGRLAAHLLRSGRCRRVVVIELSPAELELSADVPGLERRRGDGLSPLRPEDGVDTAIVAGLGGAAIAGIVGRRPGGALIRRFVLQPQTEAGRLRARLLEEGLGLVAERLVEDSGRFYTILVASPEAGTRLTVPCGLTEEDVLEAGPCLLRDRPAELARAWERQRARLTGLADRGARVAPALARASRILAYLDGV